MIHFALVLITLRIMVLCSFCADYTKSLTLKFTKKKKLFLPLTWVFGRHYPELASTLLIKQFLAEEQHFPED